jgi:DNA-binding transcriptional regulator YdaS (Cro superfamily)
LTVVTLGYKVHGMKTPLKKAIEANGSITAFAVAMGVKPPAVHKWLKTGIVPESRIERAVIASKGSVTASELRPDLARIFALPPELTKGEAA